MQTTCSTTIPRPTRSARLEGLTTAEVSTGGCRSSTEEVSSPASGDKLHQAARLPHPGGPT